MTFENIILVVYAVIIMSLFLMQGRNLKVAQFRRQLLDKMFKASDECKESFLAYEERIRVYTSVSYNSMLWTFWRKLTPENYYSDTSFLK